MTHTMTAAQVAATRRLLGLTVDQLGDELAINPRTIRAWETGKYSPSETAVLALLALRAEHDAELAELMDKVAQGPVALPSGPRERGWYLALGARILDRLPAARIGWQE